MQKGSPIRLTQKGKYSIKAMLDLQMNMHDDYVSLQAISDRQSISLHYLEQIFNRLKKNKIVVSKKGIGGGYMLARPASDITLGDIIRAVEGPIALSQCVTEKKPCNAYECSDASRCVSFLIWKNAGEKIENFFDSISLKQAGESGIIFGRPIYAGGPERHDGKIPENHQLDA